MDGFRVKHILNKQNTIMQRDDVKYSDISLEIGNVSITPKIVILHKIMLNIFYLIEYLKLKESRFFAFLVHIIPDDSLSTEQIRAMMKVALWRKKKLIVIKTQCVTK